ncbi:MAG: hypothetical protein AB1758_09360 [Candidatus Eremiobacterota bacterium]
MKSRQGVSFGTVLVVVALVMTLGFALAGVSVQHLNVMFQVTNRSQALDLARSAVALGMERVLTDNEFGTRAGEDTTLTFTDSTGQQGRLTFDRSRAAALGIPFSTNNLLGSGSVPGAGDRVVPIKTVHLVGVGTSGGVTRQVEVVIHLPPYPYAAASDGRVQASNVIVGAVDANAPGGIPAGRLRPASLLSNSRGNAMRVGAGSDVRGDLLARGKIEVENGAKVSGRVRPNQEERDLPTMTARDYDPKVMERPYVDLQASYSGSVAFTGVMRRDGNLSVGGDLDLQGAVIYVDGDVTVDGALTGKGVVAATGNITVRDHSELDAQDRVALLSQKKLTLHGGGRSSSLIHGILYSEGGFEADLLTLRGVLIARGQNPTDPTIKLSNSRVIRDVAPVAVDVGPTAGTTSFDISVGLDGELPFTPMYSPSYSGKGPGGGGVSVITVTRRQDGTYSVLKSNPVIPGIFANESDLAQRISTATGASYSEVLRQVFTASRGTPQTTVAPGFALTVKDPSQMLPIYEQARVVLWKENQ